MVRLRIFWQAIPHRRRLSITDCLLDLQERAHELLEKNGEGLLTPEEQKEMMDFSRIDHMLTLLKAKTRLNLKNATE